MNVQSKIDQLIKNIVSGATTVHLEMECSGLNLNEAGVLGRTPLMVAAAEDLPAIVEMLVRNGASVHATGNYQVTALHEASANGHAVVINYLLSLGANVDAETIQGVTPLMSASAWGHSEAARILLENGADWTKKDCYGATATEIAREKGGDVLAALIESYSRLADTE